jgi:hypothetical protein
MSVTVAAEALLPGAIIMGMWGAVIGLTHVHDWARVTFSNSVHRKVNRDLFQSYMDCRDVNIKRRIRSERKFRPQLENKA